MKLKIAHYVVTTMPTDPNEVPANWESAQRVKLLGLGLIIWRLI